MKLNSKILSDRINTISVVLAQKKGIRDRIDQQCNELKNKIDESTEEVNIKKDAYILLLAFISQRREAAIESIEETGTYALKAICGDDYRIHFLRNEERKNSAAFKMEIGIESNFHNKKVITGLKDERGGGIVEVTSFSLRFAALDWLNYNGPMILDEAFKSLSYDKLNGVGDLLKLYSNVSGRQIIFVTHEATIFEKYADNVIKIVKNKGISRVE